jgi:hypothetical protein
MTEKPLYDRQVYRLGQVPKEILMAVAAAEPPEASKRLNSELDDRSVVDETCEAACSMRRATTD